MRKKEYDLKQLLLYDQLMKGLSDAEIKKCLESDPMFKEYYLTQKKLKGKKEWHLKKECLIKDHDE